MVQQGDLTDPYYFDFISFAQYETMNREISQDPPFVFEEQQPLDGGENELQRFSTVLVRRDPNLSNDKLASEHSRLVGSSILSRLADTFADTLAVRKLGPGTTPQAGKYASRTRQSVGFMRQFES